MKQQTDKRLTDRLAGWTNETGRIAARRGERKGDSWGAAVESVGERVESKRVARRRCVLRTRLLPHPRPRSSLATVECTPRTPNASRQVLTDAAEALRCRILAVSCCARSLKRRLPYARRSQASRFASLRMFIEHINNQLHVF
ncbi:unnamed protein product [Toxocara canis]|uniref:Transposase n=1 Tax=Toxocara canis TaxID=6265 RepID=A0A183V7X1_TOXCA|nr:unnamed protein product [Toxocara canis]